MVTYCGTLIVGDVCRDGGRTVDWAAGPTVECRCHSHRWGAGRETQTQCLAHRPRDETLSPGCTHTPTWWRRGWGGVGGEAGERREEACLHMGPKNTQVISWHLKCDKMIFMNDDYSSLQPCKNYIPHTAWAYRHNLLTILMFGLLLSFTGRE